MTTLVRIAACSVVGILAFGGAAGAQSEKASPVPAPTPVAFSVRAHADVSAVMQSRTMTGSAQLAIAQRANQTRVDVLSLQSDAFPIPPIALTVVVDRGTNTIAMWSDTTKRYRVQPFLPRAPASPSPQASASARPVQRGTSPFSKLEVFQLTMKLIGHTITAGVPSTGLSFDMQVQNTGDKGLSRISATAQFADEFAAFPLAIQASIEPGAAPFSAKIAYTVDQLSRDIPPAARFDVPAGYAEAASFMAIVFPPPR